MLDKTSIGASWDSLASRSTEECGGVQESPRSSARSSPLKDASNLPDKFLVSRHNPDRTYRRESVIASWRGVKREREAALGKRTVLVPADAHRDYLGRSPAQLGVKRCRSDVAARPRVQRRVKRTCSVLHRYDPSAEQVVKEYVYRSREPASDGAAAAPAHSALHKSRSEPTLPPTPAPAAAASTPPAPANKKVRRSLTTLLKARLLNIFSPKS